MSALRFALCLLLAPLAAPADTLTVFAAASTGTALGKAARSFEDQTGHDVRLSLAGSPVLARQIKRGAPADIVLLASTDWMDVLATAGHLVEGTRRDILSNRLVVLGAANAAPLTLEDLPARLGNDRLAMALTEAVPVGQYGKAALQSLGLWDQLSGRIAQTDNARTALALVARGEAPFGILYATDAAHAAVAILANIPEDAHPPIRYPIAAVTGGNEDLARAFLAFLDTKDGQNPFADEGFVLLP